MKLLGFLVVLLCGAGCQGLTGQQSITVPELIQIMEAQNSNGCVFAIGAYPPFGQIKILAEWGVDPPDYCKPF